ncbi:ABC transporter substrate-binding protein [Ideonella sp.]|uniref:ABC transporter substrate-binding protein n=1 Tax=Ideonella sp. TaxID=1929293 RepID=UPI003BB6075D
MATRATPGNTRRQALQRMAAAMPAPWLAPTAGAAMALGLTQTASAQSTTPAAPVVLTVAAYPAIDQIIKAALPAWRQRHPEVEVKIVSREFVDHHTAMTTALSTGVHLPDLMTLEVGYVGRFAQGGGLTDLRAQPFDINRFAKLWVPYTLAQATGRSGAIVAAPGDIGPGTLLYRTDVLSRAGVDPAEMIRSWDSYVAAGERIKARTGAYLVANARDIKDVLIRTGIPPGDGLYFDAQSRVLVNSPRIVRAFELARTVRQRKLDARVVIWSSDWSEGFKRGKLATQMSGAWLAGHLNTWLAPDTRGLWRASPLPEGVQVAFGGTFFALPRKAAPERKALAWELLQLLTLAPAQQLAAFKSQDAFPALVSTHDDPFFDEPIAFLGGQTARQGWRDSARKITAVSVHKQDAFADEVINTELDKVLDQGKDIATALADAERLLARRALR